MHQQTFKPKTIDDFSEKRWQLAIAVAPWGTSYNIGFLFSFWRANKYCSIAKEATTTICTSLVTKVQNVIYLFHNPSHVILDLVAIMFNEVKGLLWSLP
jgi:hypothetical protein